MDVELIIHGMRAAWIHLKKRVKLNGKIYRKVVRPALLYMADTWATMKRQEKRLEVNETRMLRWMGGVTKKDKIRNEHVTGSVKVAPVTKQITEKRLKWYGRVKRREERYVLRRPVRGKRRRGRQKTVGKTCVKETWNMSD